MGQPSGAGDDAVELIAMQHQKTPAVGGLMDRFVRDLDAGEKAARIVAGEFVVIAGHEDDAGAIVDLGKNFGHHAALRLVPVPAALELPAIDDVADQKERVAFVVREEIGQGFGLAAAGTQMRVGDENGAMAAARPDWWRHRTLPRDGGELRGGTFEPGAAPKGRFQKGPSHRRSPLIRPGTSDLAPRRGPSS